MAQTTVAKKAHTEEIIPAVAATCTATGLTAGKKCSVCSTVLTEQTTVDALGHDWDEGTVTKEPDCTETGVKTFTCKRTGCDATQTETVAANGHTEETIPAVAATCTATGLTAGKKCSVCGTIITAQTSTSATGHKWSYMHNALKHWQVCTECSMSGTMSGHNWNSGTVKTPATEYVEGEMLHTCTICGETKTEVIAKLPHTHKWSTEWSSDGNNHWHVCTECNAHDSDAAHNWGTGTVTVQPTCTRTGTRTFTCSDCNAAKTETEPMAAHTEETIPEVNATCTEVGLTEGKKCTVCNAVTVEQTTVDALGHDWDEGTVTEEPDCTETGVKTFTCKRTGCGATQTETVAANGHTEETIPTVDATCTATGLTEGKKCMVCNTVTVEQTTVDALGHDWDEGTVTKEPDCTETGVKTFTCKRTGCGATQTETIAANGHTEETIPEVAATCTEVGLTEGKKCSVCNTIFLEQTVVATIEHIWDAGVVTTPPTESTPGIKKFTCTVCGTSKTESIPMGKITTDSKTGEGAPVTNINTPSEELIEAALSSEEKNIIKDGTDINIILKVDDASETVPEKDKQKVETAISKLSDYTLGQYLDVNLLKIIGETQEKITETKALIKVTFEIPQALRGNTGYSVVRVHDGETTVLEDEDNDPDTVTIETDKFSTYALVHKKAATPGDHTSTPSDSKPTESDTSTSTSTLSEDEKPNSGETSTGSSEGSSDNSTTSLSDEPSSSDGNSTASDTTTSPNDNNSVPSESTSSGNIENPATGITISLIPLTLALAAVTAVMVKRKKK